MHKSDELPLVESGASVAAAIYELSARDFGILGVTEGERLPGVIADGASFYRRISTSAYGDSATEAEPRDALEVRETLRLVH